MGASLLIVLLVLQRVFLTRGGAMNAARETAVLPLKYARNRLWF
jgi:hypothetical protein